MTPLYPDCVYVPLPRFSKKTQTNIAPSATRNTASARCSRDAPVISVAWSSKGPSFSLASASRRLVIAHGTRTRAHRITSTLFVQRRTPEPQQVTRGRGERTDKRGYGASVPSSHPTLAEGGRA